MEFLAWVKRELSDLEDALQRVSRVSFQIASV